MVNLASFILPALIIFPLFAALFLFFVSSENTQFIRRFGLFVSFFVFLLSLSLFLFFDPNYTKFQFVFDFIWFSPSNLNLSLGVDGISIFFILLSTLLIPICLLASWDSITKFYKEYIICFFFNGKFFNSCFFG